MPRRGCPSVCTAGEVEGTIPIAGSLDTEYLGKQLPGGTGGWDADGMRPGCERDAAGMQPGHHPTASSSHGAGLGAPGTLGRDAGSTVALHRHAGRCNRPSIVGCGAACSVQASRQRARPSRSRIPGQPGPAVSLFGEGWQALMGGCAGKRRARKSSASRPWVPQPSPVGASHGGQGLPGWRWRQITVSVPAAAYQRSGDGQTRLHPEHAELRGRQEGVPAPFTPRPAPGRFIFARVVFFPA